MTTELSKRVFVPSMMTGRFYVATYGSDAIPLPIGNVLEATLTFEEDVQQSADMSAKGGGVNYEHRRVKAGKLTIKVSDLSPTNMARATRSLTREIDAGTVTDLPFTAVLGGLLPAGVPNLGAVVLKKGATALAATTVAMDGNYEVRAAGLYLLPDAQNIADGDKLWLSGEHAAHLSLEVGAATSSELRLIFEGLNEADDDRPVILEIYRASSGLAKTLGLLTGKLGTLDSECTLLTDPTKVGSGISKYAAIKLA